MQSHGMLRGWTGAITNHHPTARVACIDAIRIEWGGGTNAVRGRPFFDNRPYHRYNAGKENVMFHRLGSHIISPSVKCRELSWRVARTKSCILFRNAFEANDIRYG